MRINVEIIRNVVAIIAQRRRIKRQEPDRGCTQLGEIIELFNQPAEIPNSIAIAVVKGLNVQLVDDRILVPKRIEGQCAVISHPPSLPRKAPGAISVRASEMGERAP